MKTGRVLPPGTRPVLLTFAGTEVCLRVTSALPSKDSDALNWANRVFDAPSWRRAVLYAHARLVYSSYNQASCQALFEKYFHP